MCIFTDKQKMQNKQAHICEYWIIFAINMLRKKQI